MTLTLLSPVEFPTRPQAHGQLRFDFSLAYRFEGFDLPFSVEVMLYPDWEEPQVTLRRLSRCCQLPHLTEEHTNQPYCPRCSKRTPPKDKVLEVTVRPRLDRNGEDLFKRRVRPTEEQKMATLERWFRLEDEDPLAVTVALTTVLYGSRAVADYVVREAGGLEAIRAARGKKFRLYPGFTKKMTLTDWLTTLLERALEGEPASSSSR